MRQYKSVGMHISAFCFYFFIFRFGHFTFTNFHDVSRTEKDGFAVLRNMSK